MKKDEMMFEKLLISTTRYSEQISQLEPVPLSRTSANPLSPLRSLSQQCLQPVSWGPYGLLYHRQYIAARQSDLQVKPLDTYAPSILPPNHRSFSSDTLPIKLKVEPMDPRTLLEGD
jgi:hypothetical protein